ncbi:MAG: hypothetical protein IPJ41_17600 [Phycisphaerales bacterium]|nr:hypothetical protein [Phycisphaerales bacterium]
MPDQTARAPRRRAVLPLVACAVVWPLGLVGCGGEAKSEAEIPTERVLGEPGTFPGQFAYPRAIDSDGEYLWVVDKAARVQQIDPATGRAGAWWRMPEFDLGKPTGITVAEAPGPDGALIPALYVADTHYHRVMVYAIPTALPERPAEIEPELLSQFGAFGQEPGQFIYPTDVAVLMSDDGSKIERIYVSEYGGNDRISVFDAEERFLFAIGGPGEGLDPKAIEFARPQSMAIDTARRELIVTDACNHRLGRFTLDGELLGWIGSPTPAPDAPVKFEFPYGLLLLDDSTVLVTEFGGSRVQQVDPVTGASLRTFGHAGRGEGEVATPWASAVIGRETYLLDSGNNRILVAKLPGVEGGRG